MKNTQLRTWCALQLSGVSRSGARTGGLWLHQLLPLEGAFLLLGPTWDLVHLGLPHPTRASPSQCQDSRAGAGSGASPGIGSQCPGFVPVKPRSLRIYSTSFFFYSLVFVKTIFYTFSLVVKQLFKWYCPYFGDLVGQERSWNLNHQDLLLKCENNSLKAAASVPPCDAVHRDGLISFPGASSALCRQEGWAAGSKHWRPLHSGKMPQNAPRVYSEV